MHEPLQPWWQNDLLTHPSAAAQAVDSGPRWKPTPVPMLRLQSSPAAFSVVWELSRKETSDLEVEVVGDRLVLRATHAGQQVSRAVPVPKDVNLARRRDHWKDGLLTVVMPRILPTVFGRFRLWISRLLHRFGTWIAPKT